VSASTAPYVAVLNDDTTVCAGWLAALVEEMERGERVGMCASKVILAEENVIDSAGMLLCADGSSKQRGHGRAVTDWMAAGDCLLPSGSAALYRRRMLVETGGFDGRFFLYCEDTDLGLRAIWRGWRCRYVANAQVRHHYSQTAGRVSPLKAFYVERNRHLLVWKTFPLRMLWRVPFTMLARYFFHFWSLRGKSSAASQFVRGGNSAWRLALLPFHAALAALPLLPHAWKARRRLLRDARIDAGTFTRICRMHSISAKEVAEL
jgi:GT2 family glycosyltransferase